MSGSQAPETRKGQSGIYRAALFGLCPKCGARTLFDAPAMVADECSSCDLQLGELEPGGRFAPLLLTVWVIVILICAALALDNFLTPPLWVHVLLWAPLTIALELFALRAYRSYGVNRAYERQRTAYVQSEPN